MASEDDNVVAVPLENTRQTAAYAYSATYSPTSPKFSRGLALCHGEDATLFISGTASITNSKTRQPTDVVAQTHETIDTITALISEDNLSRHSLAGWGTTMAGLGVVRVYVKRPQVYASVRAVCEQRLGAVPAIYVVADVCRPDLLVEIEGVAFARKTPMASSAAPRRRCVAPALACSESGKSGERAPYCPETCQERALKLKITVDGKVYEVKVANRIRSNPTTSPRGTDPRPRCRHSNGPSARAASHPGPGRRRGQGLPQPHRRGRGAHSRPGWPGHPGQRRTLGPGSHEDGNRHHRSHRWQNRQDQHRRRRRRYQRAGPR